MEDTQSVEPYRIDQENSPKVSDSGYTTDSTEGKTSSTRKRVEYSMNCFKSRNTNILTTKTNVNLRVSLDESLGSPGVPRNGVPGECLGECYTTERRNSGRSLRKRYQTTLSLNILYC